MVCCLTQRWSQRLVRRWLRLTPNSTLAVLRAVAQLLVVRRFEPIKHFEHQTTMFIFHMMDFRRLQFGINRPHPERLFSALICLVPVFAKSADSVNRFIIWFHCYLSSPNTALERTAITRFGLRCGRRLLDVTHGGRSALGR